MSQPKHAENSILWGHLDASLPNLTGSSSLDSTCWRLWEGSILRKLMIFAALAVLVFSQGVEAEAASKTKTLNRSDYSKEQQKKLYDAGMKLCRNKLRTHLNFIKVDYKRKRYVCFPEPSSANRQNLSIMWGDPAFLK
jgi:hypothetical protein